MWIKRLSDGADIPIAMAGNAKPGNPIWSPDGKQFAFTPTFDHGIELWIATAATGERNRYPAR